MLFDDRADAGRRLAGRLRHLRGGDAVVAGLARGGVAVAFEVARELGLPLDLIAVRKLGVPYQPELGFGAIGEDGARVIDERVVRMAGLAGHEMVAVEEQERVRLQRHLSRLRGGRARAEFAGRTVILVDDGIATGSTARAACMAARARGAARVVLAVPVGPPDAVTSLREAADEVICLDSPGEFGAVGAYYRDFSQVSDDEVREYLARAAAGPPAAGVPAVVADPPDPEEVRVDAGDVPLAGILAVPEGAAGLVIFAHGSGSSRHSPRNRFVAGALNAAGLATLLVDLLTPREELDRGNVFNTGLLALRLAGIAGWARGYPVTAGLPVCYFGASTGAAAALRAAAGDLTPVSAIVSRGGRPDLAGQYLAAVRSPVLLVVGGADRTVLDLNRKAQQMLTCENRLVVVPGATHLFEEPGTLEQVAELAAWWFRGHLPASRSDAGGGDSEDGRPDAGKKDDRPDDAVVKASGL